MARQGPFYTKTFCLKRFVAHCSSASMMYNLKGNFSFFLLQAASFGKSFLTDMPPQAFVSMCQSLRVLNAVRDYMVGMPLTYGQYPLRFSILKCISCKLLLWTM